MRKYVYILTCLLMTLALQSQGWQKNLHEQWQFKRADSGSWYPAQVPGNVFSDLQRNKLIGDPYLGTNHLSLAWVSEKDWLYACRFNISKQEFSFQHLDLVFEGLDTHADIYVNDSLVRRSHNMFVSQEISVKKFLKVGENSLQVKFYSPVAYGRKAAANLPYTLPEGIRVFLRKVQCTFGWDFAPALPGCGIWKTVSIHGWSDVRIRYTHYDIDTLNDTLASVRLMLETASDIYRSLQVNVSYPEQDQYGTHLRKASKKIMVHEGINYDTLVLRIPRPRLWWCRGMGKAQLYRLNLQLYEDRYLHDAVSLSMGLRRLVLENKKDSLGKSFYFTLNGKPLFVKGANVVPMDVLMREQSPNNLLQRCREANINMLRLWGGGAYADEQLLQACDREGILLWQDFAFACAMYPGDDQFMDLVREEVDQQIRRLKNHPSLALWCGNNEIDEAWHHWGWQKQMAYSAKDSSRIWQDYLRVFEQLIPQRLAQWQKNYNYWPSSPSIGWGDPQSLRAGDVHYWGVWWGMQDFALYRQKVGRFMSEYGFQSLPNMTLLSEVCEGQAPDKNHPAIKAHQKHPTGFETIDTYMARDYNMPKTFEEYVYVSQLLQRDGMKIAIEVHRAANPTCMGTMFWQLNDCWPGISWSAIDYGDAPKAFYYQLKQSYATSLVRLLRDKYGIGLQVISDSLQDIKVPLRLCLKDMQAKVLWQHNMVVNISGDKVYADKIPWHKLPVFDSTKVYLTAVLGEDNHVLARNTLFFCAPKFLKLTSQKIQLLAMGDGRFRLKANSFAKDVFVYDKDGPSEFSDNFFNMEAGEVKELRMVKGRGVRVELIMNNYLDGYLENK